MICLPPAFDPTKKYPLIVYYYGGTTPTERGIGSPYCAQLFASRDYVVYVIQPSGTIGLRAGVFGTPRQCLGQTHSR